MYFRVPESGYPPPPDGSANGKGWRINFPNPYGVDGWEGTGRAILVLIAWLLILKVLFALVG